jgi:lactoylglutathione lyase
MPRYTYDHIHLRTKDPEGMADYFRRVFDAKVIGSVQSDGRPRVDLDIDGLIVFIAPVAADAEIPASPSDTSASTTLVFESTASTTRSPN